MPKFMENPSDPGISTLAAVLDPAELAKQLSQLALPQEQWHVLQGIRLRVLKWKKTSRCTFEIALETEHGQQDLIGKVYAEDRSDVYHAMEEISRAGFGPEEEYAIPRPVGYLAPMRLLLYEKVPGTRARVLIVNPNESDHVPAVERCARWLARFQARAPRSGRIVRLNDQLSFLEECWRSLAELGWPFADKASRLFEQLNATARGFGSMEMCAGHGMYTSGQVLLVESRTVTVDWDTYRVADPSYDVARMLVGFKRLGLRSFGSMHALDGAAEVFLRTYVASIYSDVTPHLAFQKAAICLERAKRDLDKQTRGWRERA